MSRRGAAGRFTKQFTLEQEREIARRIRIREANSTKNLMAEFKCSRSLIDRISRESKMLLDGVPHETKQNAFRPLTELELDALAEQLKRA